MEQRTNLNPAIEEIVTNFIESNEKVKEYQFPNSLTVSQLENLLNSLSKIKDVQVDIKWFYPTFSVILQRKEKIGNLDKDLSIVTDLSKIRLNFEPTVREQINKLLTNKAKRLSPFYRVNDLQQSNFNIITYINTEPFIPTKFSPRSSFFNQSSNGSFNQQNNFVLNEHDELLLRRLNITNQIHVLTGLSKNDKLNLSILLNNQAFLEQKSCRIIYLQSMSILTFWMALAVKDIFGDFHWNCSGYQITLESKSSPNNNIIFFELATFIRALNRGIETSLITHIIVDIDHNHFFFNLFLLYMKENFEQFHHMKMIIFARNRKQSMSLVEYFKPEKVDCVDYYQLFLENTSSPPYPRIQFEQFYLDDLKNLFSNSIAVKPFNTYHNQDLERLMCQISNGNSPLTSIIDFLRLYPSFVNYQCTNLNGITPLILAVMRGTVDEVYRILSFGANCHQTSSNGMEPIEWAFQRKNEDLFNLLFVHRYAINEAFDLNLQGYYSPRFKLTQNSESKLIQKPSMYEVNYSAIIYLIENIIRKVSQTNVPGEPMGSIVVLLPSYNKISTLRKMIISKLSSTVEHPFTIFCLYPHLPNNELDIAVDLLNTIQDQLRVILSTFNLDSLLLRNVRCVINTGVLLEKVLSPFSSVNLYRLVSNQMVDKLEEYQHYNQLFVSNQPISFFNLYSEQDVLNDKQSEMDLEIDSIYHCIFASKLIKNNNEQESRKITDMFSKMITKPRKFIIDNTIQYLKEINVFDQNECFTELGRILLDLSIEPHYAKMIIYSVILRCLDPILTIVCALSSSNCFEITWSNLEQRNEEMQSLFTLSHESFSDHLTYVYAFQKWQELCRANPKNVTSDKNGIILFSSFELIYSLRTKILGQLRACGFVKGKGAMNIRQLNSNSENFSLVKAAICAGQPLQHFAIVDPKSFKVTHSESKKNGHAFIHPNSVLCYHQTSNMNISMLENNLIMFDRKFSSGNVDYLANCTLVNPLTVAIFSDAHKPELISLKNNSIQIGSGAFSIEGEDAEKCYELRLRWQQYATKRILNMHSTGSEEDNCWISDLIELCSSADVAAGFNQHPSIGRAPQVMSTYFCSTKMITPK